MYRLRRCLFPHIPKHRSIVGASSCLFLLSSTAALSSRSKNAKLDEERPIDDTTKQQQQQQHQNDPFDIIKRWTKSNAETLANQRNNLKDNNPSLVDELVGWAANGLSRMPDEDNTNDSSESFLSAIKGFAELVTGTDESKGRAMQNLIQRARSSSGSSSGDIQDSQSYNEVLAVLRQDLDAVSKSIEGSVGHIDWSQLFPTSLFYFLEAEDERKNPSWKRRMHRFCPGINIDEVNTLNNALYLAELSYEKSIEVIKAGLEESSEPFELVHVTIEGEPRKPAHFVALKKQQSIWSSALDIIIVVRGTSTITDAITDCICEPVDYRGGKAHSGILDSGKYLVQTHLPLLENLKKMSGKRSLNITLIGHSLGAGAAAIAGMELQDRPDIHVNVIGFGCPALLSENLSKEVTSYMTTVIDDSDMVPRLSGATIGNLLLDIQEFDYVPSSRRDIVQAFDELEHASPGTLPKSLVQRLMENVEYVFRSYVSPTIKPASDERTEPVLFPPGRCVHFYRDGYGITGNITPCTFFREIDLSRRMIDDHLITPGYRQIFLDLMRQYHNDQQFSFDESTNGSN